MIIGAQLYTVRESCKTLEDLENTFKRCSEMGFKAVQLSAICEYDPSWMKEKLEKYGLVAPITHSKYDRIIGDTEKLIEEHKIIGADYIGLGAIPNFKKSGSDFDLLKNALDELMPAIQKIGDSGLKFMYHNHNYEFAHTPDGEVMLEYVARTLPKDASGITLDCYWVTAGGGDPAWWLRHLGGRIDCIHYKDMVYYGPETATRMAPVGYGNLNYEEIIKASVEAGVKYAFIEQDHCYEEDTFVALNKSLTTLRKLGCKD